MSKYTPDQLSDMASQVIAVEAANGESAFQVYILVAMMTGMDPTDVRSRIYQYTSGGAANA